MAASSKPLFRATRAKPDRGPVLAMDLPEQRAPEEARRAEDFYPTGQPEEVRALMAREASVIRGLIGLDPIWEPACGDGAMVAPQRNAWFVWRADWSGPPEFRWLDREDSRQGCLL